MTPSAQIPHLTAPHLTLEAFSAALGNRDAEQAAACFCRDARLITADRTTVSGRAEIAPVLAQLIDAQAEFDFSLATLHTAGEVALLRGRCPMRSKGPDLFWLTQTSDLTVVLQAIEGDWKLAIFAPWEGNLDTEVEG